MNNYILKNNEIYSVSKEVDIHKYVKTFGGVVISKDSDVIKRADLISNIDLKLDILEKKFIHNETYQHDVNYETYKLDMLKNFKELRLQRANVENLSIKELEELSNVK